MVRRLKRVSRTFTRPFLYGLLGVHTMLSRISATVAQHFSMAREMLQENKRKRSASDEPEQIGAKRARLGASPQ